MKLTYDPKVKAVYIYLTDITPYFGVVDHTQELTDNVLVDWMKDGTLWGIEVLGVESKPIIGSREACGVGVKSS